jgi:6-phospho-beta-glucosidase
MNPPVITIVGGGASVPRLCEALAHEIALPEVVLRLTARRLDRVRVLADHSAKRIAAARPRWSVEAAPSLETALESAAIVVLLVRVGGLEARAWDESFPGRLGLVGDEGLGPGGVANAWRTLPELASIARAIRQVAPAARVINLMGPLGPTTRLLLDYGLRAVGVCELPQATLEAWLASADATDATWQYGGLNHLGWFWEVRSGDRDVLRLLSGSAASPDRKAPIDRMTVEHYHAAPLRYFYEVFDPEAGRRLGLTRAPTRARELKALSESLVERYSASPGQDARDAETRPTPWLDRVTAPIASAFLRGPAYAGFVDLLNGGTIPELPPDTVVEVAATFTADGATPVPPGPLPEPVARFLGDVARAEALAYAAGTRQDPDLLADAMRALPLSIPEPTVAELARLARAEPADFPATG